MSTKVSRIFDFPYYQLEKYNLPKAFTTKYDGKWVSISTQEYINRANSISRGLLNLGVQPNDKIAIISSNRGGLTEMIEEKGILISDINKELLEKSITNFITKKSLLVDYQNKSWNNYIYNQTTISQIQDKIRMKILDNFYKFNKN